MAINLPPQPVSVPLPAQPQDSPTLDDVIAAQDFKHLVEGGAGQKDFGPTRADVARADVYKTQLLMAHDPLGAAPAWFIPAMNQVLPQALAQAMTQAMPRILAPIQTTIAQARNCQLVDGRFTPFVLIPFLNGRMPDEPPYNLPPLLTANSIRNLTAVEATAYVNGYGLGPFHLVADRKKAIGRYIGCIEDI